MRQRPADALPMQPVEEPSDGRLAYWDTRIYQARADHPETKGVIERANGYLETSFMPGRSFASPADFNTQLAGWLPWANERVLRCTGARPVSRVGADAAAMTDLLPVTPTTGVFDVPRPCPEGVDPQDDRCVHPSSRIRTQMLSREASISSSRWMEPAAALASRCTMSAVPGMRSTFGECWSSQASPTCDGVR